MKKGYYFVAKYVKNGITRICTGTQETIDGYFDFVSAGNFIAQKHNVDSKDVIVTFWSEINSVMLDKYKSIREQKNDRIRVRRQYHLEKLRLLFYALCRGLCRD